MLKARTWKQAALTAVLLVVVTTVFPACAPEAETEIAAECQTVRFVEVNWMDIEATTATTRLVLEALGYRTTAEVVSVPIAYQAMESGDADVFLGHWMPSMATISDAFIKDRGTVESISTNLQGAKYTLAVPRYVYEAGVQDLADLIDYKDRFEGRIYGIEAGNDGNELIQAMIDEDAFGLSEFELIESSEAGMLGEVNSFTRNEEWIVFLGWAPHPMNTAFEIEYLSGGDDYFGPDYGAATVHTNVRTGYHEECENVGRFLQDLRFTVEMENEIMSAMDAGAHARDAGRDWLLENPSILEEWLDGVVALDGSDGLSAVRTALGLD